MIEKTCLIEKFCFNEIELLVHIPFKFIAVFKRDETDQQSENAKINPSNAEATFIKSPRMQRFFINHLNPVMLVFIG